MADLKAKERSAVGQAARSVEELGVTTYHQRILIHVKLVRRPYVGAK
jgi:hypothetical protein